MRRGKLQLRKGFSLIEVLIGMVILMIALASAAALSLANANLITKNQYAVHAENLAEMKMEELRNMTVATVQSGADAGRLNSYGAADNTGSFTRSWTVLNEDFQIQGLKRVEVRVTWTQTGGTQSYALRGVLGDAN
jgi:prepilin-type N-terminal cleavage/methylation domain-containing protein